MEPLREYHHFKKNLLVDADRVSKIERYVVDLLLESRLPDSERESSICWELKHQASTLQFARILALKRGLPVDICAIGLMLHDVSSIANGVYKNHAHQSTEIAMQILPKLGDFSDQELDEISRIIYNHSDKHVWTDDPFQEFGKDVDVLDCFLYEGAFDFYLGNKSLPAFVGYLERAKKIWKELNLPSDAKFNLLDGFGLPWFQNIQALPVPTMRGLLAVLLELSDLDKSLGLCPPPFCILVDSDNVKFCANQQKWTEYTRHFSTLCRDDLIEYQLTRKLLLMFDALKEILEKEPRRELASEINLLSKKTVSMENLQKAENVLPTVESLKDCQPYALLIWPIVGIYEVLKGNKTVDRLAELGIKVVENAMVEDNE